MIAYYNTGLSVVDLTLLSPLYVFFSASVFRPDSQGDHYGTEPGSVERIPFCQFFYNRSYLRVQVLIMVYQKILNCFDILCSSPYTVLLFLYC